MQSFYPEFDGKWAYPRNDLGPSYTKESTTWKVWAPEAESVVLRLYSTGSNIEPGSALLAYHKMKQGERGVWSITLEGDFDGVYYTYTVKRGQIRNEVPDIYAKACGVNGERSMVADLSSVNPDGWESDRHVLPEKPTDAIIWEVHVRDFSEDEKSGMQHKGKYLAFTEEGTAVPGWEDLATGIAYLKDLGITHVHLMPVMDIKSVDESVNPPAYNWGYDPAGYFIPEGAYATDPYNGKVRILECKRMIQALHRAGIGVILDVVYNHTFQTADSVYEKTVPGYYYRMLPNGAYANGSGCGNELATERTMVRHLIFNSIRYWVEEYHVDGFRFDLLGLMDLETATAIRNGLNGLPEGRKILMYGEPWAAAPALLPEGICPADKAHRGRLPRNVAIFSDDTRDAVKGTVFDKSSTGFVNGAWGLESAIQESLKGWSGPFSEIRVPSGTISYVSAHDNYTLWDKLILASGTEKDGYDLPREDIMSANRLAAGLVLLSQGIPFMQAGEEFGRTKYGDGNSYCSPIEVNRLDWGRTDLFRELVEFYKGLICIRKAFPAFRDDTGRSVRNMVFSPVRSRTVAFTMPDRIGEKDVLLAVIFNASAEEQEVELYSWADRPFPKEWQMLCDGLRAGTESLETLKPMEHRSNTDTHHWIKIGPRTMWVLVSE